MDYHLHGVCIHDGTAESGHYYSYIKDHKQGVWRCYNDHRVSIVEESQVYEEANGGSLTKSAYYITYISQNELNNTRNVDMNTYEPNDRDFTNKHPYGKIAKAEIIQKIIEDNRKLQTEVDDFKATEIAKKVTTTYEKAFEDIQKIMD